MKSNSANDFWDEHKWESHINEAEQKSEEIRHFLDKTFGSEGPRWVKILQESESEHEALDTFIEEELLLDEAYLPDDDDDWDADDFEDDDDDFFAECEEEMKNILGDLFIDPETALQEGSESDDDQNAESSADSDLASLDDMDDMDDFDEIEEGEEWKMLSEDYTLSDFGSLENLDVYTHAHDFGAHMLVRSANLTFDNPEDQQLYNRFMADVLQISAKIAAGYSLGFYDDMIGGNIAFCKKALQAANRALESLQLIKEKRLVFGEVEYRQLHCDLFEIRNDLGIYIQDLREMFDDFQLPPF